MCCEDCRTEKLKSNILNKILLNEHCISISEYLGCDGCCKMNAILNDPIYKTLDTNNKKYLCILKCVLSLNGRGKYISIVNG